MSELSDRPQPGLRRLLSAITVDPTPLYISRDYRLLFIGQAVSAFGSMMTYAVLPWQMYQITKSSFAVGMIGVTEFLPMFIFAFIGGALADAIDRRRLIIITEVAMTLCVGGWLVNAMLPQPKAWVLFVIAAVFSAMGSLQRPAREALLPRLLPSEQMAAAAALGSLRYTVAAIVGPAIGGVLAVSLGAGLAYAIDFATFLISLVCLLQMRTVPPPENADDVSWQSILDGLRYAWGRKELLGTYLIDINAMFFGMPMALFPAMAESFGNASVGLFYAMPAVGAFFASLLSGWTKEVNKHGLAIILAASVWGLAIIAFGLATNLWLAMFFLALAGAADMISGLFRMVIWNQTIPDHLRGRLAGIELISYASGPMLGNAEAGIVASLFSVRSSVISGGVLCVLGSVVLAALLPSFLRYDGQEGLARKRTEEQNRTAMQES
ncbi:MAG: MFS transporter [Acidobacteria bacterium]|nr:MFS transporter [Acidobacteriota bacterium]